MKIIICVVGGCVQQVFAEEPDAIEVVLDDLDHETGPVPFPVDPLKPLPDGSSG